MERFEATFHIAQFVLENLILNFDTIWFKFWYYYETSLLGDQYKINCNSLMKIRLALVEKRNHALVIFSVVVWERSCKIFCQIKSAAAQYEKQLKCICPACLVVFDGLR